MAASSLASRWAAAVESGPSAETAAREREYQRRVAAVRWVDTEIRKLIAVLSAPGAPSTFGALFSATVDTFEALSGTLVAARKRGVVEYEGGGLLLSGTHDKVAIRLLKTSIPDSAIPERVTEPAAGNPNPRASAPVAPRKTRGFDTIDAANDKCGGCGKRVYAAERVDAAGMAFHRPCFVCTQCRCTLRTTEFCMINKAVYCRPHYLQIFARTGNYDGFSSQAAQGGAPQPATKPAQGAQPPVVVKASAEPQPARPAPRAVGLHARKRSKTPPSRESPVSCTLSPPPPRAASAELPDEQKRSEQVERNPAELLAQRLEEENRDFEAKRLLEEEERKAREEEARRAREEEEERKAREAEAKRLREEAERKVREAEVILLREEEERKAREAEAKRLREEAEKKAREEEARKAHEAEVQRLREEAEKKAREEEARRAREEEERKGREAKRLRDEAENKAREEREKRLRDEEARKAHEAEVKRLREEEERKAREAEIKRLRDEEERKAREEERRAREAEAQRLREEEARRLHEEEEQRTREAEAKRREEERKAREEEARRLREEEERRAREKEATRLREEEERKAREAEAQRLREEEVRKRAAEEKERISRAAEAEAERRRLEQEMLEEKRAAEEEQRKEIARLEQEEALRKVECRRQSNTPATAVEEAVRKCRERSSERLKSRQLFVEAQGLEAEIRKVQASTPVNAQLEKPFTVTPLVLPEVKIVPFPAEKPTKPASPVVEEEQELPEEYWVAEAIKIGPPEPPMPTNAAHASKSKKAYKEFMKVKYVHEEWENQILLISRKLRSRQKLCRKCLKPLWARNARFCTFCGISTGITPGASPTPTHRRTGSSALSIIQKRAVMVPISDLPPVGDEWAVISLFLDYLLANGTYETDVFRATLFPDELRALWEETKGGTHIADITGYSCNSVGVCLKRLLFMKNPIIPYQHFETLLVLRRMSFGATGLMLCISEVIPRIPIGNAVVLYKLLILLKTIAEHEATTQNNMLSLGSIFGPAVMRPKSLDSVEIARLANIHTLVAFSSEMMTLILNDPASVFQNIQPIADHHARHLM